VKEYRNQNTYEIIDIGFVEKTLPPSFHILKLSLKYSRILDMEKNMHDLQEQEFDRD
jgi:hypothetical protein